MRVMRVLNWGQCPNTPFGISTIARDSKLVGQLLLERISVAAQSRFESPQFRH
jgi:hypothetical protein